MSDPKNGTKKNNTEANSTNEKEIKPRKRLITKNIQLFATVGVFLFSFLFLVGWKMFFDQSPLGAWHMVTEMENEEQYIETMDYADVTESGYYEEELVKQSDDSAANDGYNTLARYEFTKDGVCRVTFGSMTAEGSFDIASTEDYGNVISIAVSYDASPILYGIYKYKVEGNVFTGKKLVLDNAYVDGDVMVLDKGKGKDTLKPFDNPVLDEKLVGTWYDTENDISYKFTKNGEMYRIMSGTLSIRHYYTILGENMFIARYITDTEQTDTYTYYFDNDGNLYIDDYLMNKINE